jgi:hypothetical protein
VLVLMMMAAGAEVDVAALASGAAPLLEVEVATTSSWYVSVEGVSIEIHLDILLLGHHLRDAIHGLVHAAEN